MLIHQIYEIGKVFSANESANSIIDILVAKQNDVKPGRKNELPRVLVLTADLTDLTNIQITPSLMDFDENQKRKYLLGMTTGTAQNLSLSVSTGWEPETVNKKGEIKPANFPNFDKITGLLKKHADDTFFDQFNPEGLFVKPLLQAIMNQKEQINQKIDMYLKSEGYTSFKNPLIFAIKQADGITRLQGEVFALLKLYEILAISEKILLVQSDHLRCCCCGSDKDLQEGFNMGMFSLDHSSFQKQFFVKQENLGAQYVMCSKCHLITSNGFNILQEKLQYRAYFLKDGRTNIPIFHFILPLTSDLTQLKREVNEIADAKRSSNAEKKANLEQQIQILQQKMVDLEDQRKFDVEKMSEASTSEGGLTQINKKTSKRTTKKSTQGKNDEESKKIQQQIENLQEKTGKATDDFSTLDLIMQRWKTPINGTNGRSSNKDLPMPILDVYFKITNQKLNPKTIEIVSEVEYSTNHILKLGEILRKAADRFSRVKPLYLLKYLVDERHFIPYYSQLLSLKPISRRLFQKHVVEVVKSLFINDLIGNTNDLDGFSKHEDVMQFYEQFAFMLTEGNLWVE